MKVPTIHRNGTDKDDLLNALHELGSTLHVAQCEIVKTAPNARDYYPQGPDAFREATAEHADRVRRLDALHTEVYDLYNAIDAQGT